MPDDPERYVSANALREEIPFTAADFPVQDAAQFDAALERALGAASDSVESWAGTVFVPTTTTTTLARPAYAAVEELPLPGTPIHSVTSVSVLDDPDTGDRITLTVGEDVTARDAHLRLLSAAPIDEWPTEYADGVIVEYEYGYDRVPGAVEEAIVRLARNRLDQIETDGYESDADGWSYRPPEEVKEACRSQVEQYEAPDYTKTAGAMVI